MTSWVLSNFKETKPPPLPVRMFEMSLLAAPLKASFTQNKTSGGGGVTWSSCSHVSLLFDAKTLNFNPVNGRGRSFYVLLQTMEQVSHRTVTVWLWTDVSSDWTVSVWCDDLTGSSWMQNNEESCSWIHSDSSSAFPVEIIRLSPSGGSDRLEASSVLLLLLTDGNSFEHDEEHFDGRFLISKPNFKIASVRLWQQWRNRRATKSASTQFTAGLKKY